MLGSGLYSKALPALLTTSLSPGFAVDGSGTTAPPAPAPALAPPKPTSGVVYTTTSVLLAATVLGTMIEATSLKNSSSSLGLVTWDGYSNILAKASSALSNSSCGASIAYSPLTLANNNSIAKFPALMLLLVLLAGSSILYVLSRVVNIPASAESNDKYLPWTEATKNSL
ncbi:hypothetical protein ASSaV_gp18 [Abalone shriveling syndrome-associated virus]|uniref:hypothetical protein n=1 Tax=Abalone shriveling syndrome-associated virus TaxID=491893 RepID=UPI0001881BB2|nr:hypothetical protein ASSaV_gp18 [Abalone shriveling syndrome-associated virus]ACJ71987.1 unknown [Abalone shriveling syndrome-associated virus]